MLSGSPATSMGVSVSSPSISLKLRSWPLPAYVVRRARVDQLYRRAAGLRDRRPCSGSGTPQAQGASESVPIVLKM